MLAKCGMKKSLICWHGQIFFYLIKKRCKWSPSFKLTFFKCLHPSSAPLVKSLLINFVVWMEREGFPV